MCVYVYMANFLKFKKRIYVERALFYALAGLSLENIRFSIFFAISLSGFFIFPVAFSYVCFEEYLCFQTLARDRCYVFPPWRDVAITFSRFGAKSLLRFPHLARDRLYAFKVWRNADFTF